MVRACLFSLIAPMVAWCQLAGAFEAKRVVVKIDMPATHDGVDLFPEREQPLELRTYQSRLKQFGIAVRNGDSILVTKVKVKDKTVEFHLGGGGYGTFWDESGTVTASTIAKSSRERSLEDRLRNEKDPGRRRELESDLRYEQRERERRNSLARAEAERATAINKQRIAAKRLDAGSRFNIRFESTGAAEAATPEQIRRILSQYLVFEGQ